MQLIKDYVTISSQKIVYNLQNTVIYIQATNRTRGENLRMAKLNYKTLRQEVVDQIRQKILQGELKAGERIKENEIAEMFGVSRGPVREALRQIEQEGLIHYERNVGCSVAKVTQQDVYEICLLRAMLEITAVRLCKGTLSSSALKKMKTSVENMKELEQDLYCLAQEDNNFHACVVEELGFQKMEHIWKGMNASNFAVFCAIDKKGIGDCHERHERLLECYEKGNPEEIVTELKRHYGLGTDFTDQDMVKSSCSSVLNLEEVLL